MSRKAARKGKPGDEVAAMDGQAAAEGRVHRPAAAQGGSFREFMTARKPEAAKRYVPPDVPTPERIAKGDQPYKAGAGYFRAPPPIERLRNRKQLDPEPQIAQAMVDASAKLLLHFTQAGLGGIKAQDISRCVGGGDGGSSNFPKTERAMHHRQAFREACSVMGWHSDFPLRGAGRLVVDVACYEMGVADAARIHIGSGRTEVVVASGMDRLREGLFALARHWGMLNRRSARG